MAKNVNLETKASAMAKEILAVTQNNWVMAARELMAKAKEDPEVLQEIVGPLISDRIWQAIDRVIPINMGGGSLLTVVLSATEQRMLGDATKPDLENEIAFYTLHARKCIENIDWIRTVSAELEEGKTVREKFNEESIVAFREKFEKEWKGELRLESNEEPSKIRQLAVEAVQMNKGEWMLALQSLTQLVTTDAKVLYQLTAPVFYTMVWMLLSRVAEETIHLEPPLNYTLSSGWIFGDSTIADLKNESDLWEDSARCYLRKIKWLELILENVSEGGRVDENINGPKVKNLWKEACKTIG